ncbi:MAG: 16S rRNA (cytosine(967)-C(5))-methyltransferase RsmB [Myxococcota bacterium]
MPERPPRRGSDDDGEREGGRRGGRARPRRGRPEPRVAAGHHRRGGPTLARQIAVRVLERVERVRAFADLALHHALASTELSGADRALATEIVYGTLRWRGRIDFVLGHVLDRDLEKLEPMVASILRAGAYQLLFADRIPASAAVDESVRCARALGAGRASGLVNAVLRRLARDHVGIPVPALDKDPHGHLVHALSVPPWIAERWLERFPPDEAAALARASNEPAPRTVRANRARTTRDALLARLRERYDEARPCAIARDGIALGRGAAPSRHPAFLAGEFSMQDEASQLVVELLDPQPGELVLDVCAAPGTKALAIAERVGDAGRVVACDRHAGRLRLVARDARRLGLAHVETLVRDGAESLEDLVPEGRAGFDRVLVDAPCSGLGSLRRNPDARWRIRPADVEALADLQRRILDRAAAVVRPGGVLVYSTCTLLPEENERQADAFAQRHPELRRCARRELPAHLTPALRDDGALECLPHVHGTDGFYAARFARADDREPEGAR